MANTHSFIIFRIKYNEIFLISFILIETVELLKLLNKEVSLKERLKSFFFHCDASRMDFECFCDLRRIIP